MNLNYAGSKAAWEAPETFPGLRSKSDLAPTLMIDAERDLLRASGEDNLDIRRPDSIELIFTGHAPHSRRGHRPTPDSARQKSSPGIPM
jgi:hypothetical protein